jgi:glycerol dehydrogenase
MNGVHFVAGTPNAYLQEVGLINAAGDWIAKYGKRIFVVTGTESWAQAGKKLTESLDRTDITYDVAVYSGECTYREINRLEALVELEVELIVGLGGGKVMDTAKKLSDAVRRPFVAVPTLAGSCAAATNLSAMYSEDGLFMEDAIFYRNSLLVLVDSDLIARAPARYLTAGIGGALAKWYESTASSSGKRQDLPTIGALQATRLSYDTLLQTGIQAVEDARQHRASLALQKVIDAIILFSGMTVGLGEDNCRPAAAHAVYIGLQSIVDIKHSLYGEKVAYGLLIQLALEQRPESECRELLAFYKAIGLPRKLRELGLQRPLEEAEIEEWIRLSLSPVGMMGNMPFEVTAEQLLHALHKVESWEI